MKWWFFILGGFLLIGVGYLLYKYGKKDDHMANARAAKAAKAAEKLEADEVDFEPETKLVDESPSSNPS